jgi:hypothetical protein
MLFVDSNVTLLFYNQYCFKVNRVLGRTNPLFIIRMMAHMVLRAISIANEDKEKKKTKSQV